MKGFFIFLLPVFKDEFFFCVKKLTRWEKIRSHFYVDIV